MLDFIVCMICCLFAGLAGFAIGAKAKAEEAANQREAVENGAAESLFALTEKAAELRDMADGLLKENSTLRQQLATANVVIHDAEDVAGRRRCN